MTYHTVGQPPLSQTDDKVGVVVGLRWWGTSIDDIAASMCNDGLDVVAWPLWDIERRSHRAMMRFRRLSTARLRRLARRDQDRSSRWSVIINPHRLTVASCRALAHLGPRYVVLGDRPRGARTVHPAVWADVTRVVTPDPTWLDAVPSHVERIVIDGWGHTLTDPELLGGATYEPESLAIVGAPYAERVAIARRLAERFQITVQGNGWAGLVDGATVRPAAGRLATMRQLRSRREAVVNVHHTQFAVGRNPQFADWAAAGIPQLVVRPGQPQRASGDAHWLELRDLSFAALAETSAAQIETTRARGSFSQVLERAGLWT